MSRRGQRRIASQEILMKPESETDVLHFQFFPEDKITTIYIDDPLPCPKKKKFKKSAVSKKKALKKKLLVSERCILKKEWNKFQSQLLKRSKRRKWRAQKDNIKTEAHKKVKHSAKALPNYTPPLLKQRPNSNDETLSMPVLHKPMNQMTVSELVQYKNNFNRYIRSVCHGLDSTDQNKQLNLKSPVVESSPSIKGKSPEVLKLTKSSDLASSIENDSSLKQTDSQCNIESDNSIGSDDKGGGKMEIASELIAEGIHILSKKKLVESSSGDPNMGDLNQLIRKLKNFQRKLDRPSFLKPSKSKSQQSKVASVHAPPLKLTSSNKQLKPQINECNFPFGKIEEHSNDNLPWVKETIKKSNQILKKCDSQFQFNKAYAMNENLTCDSKIWLDIEKLLDDRNNTVDVFVGKVMAKLQKKNFNKTDNS